MNKVIVNMVTISSAIVLLSGCVDSNTMLENIKNSKLINNYNKTENQLLEEKVNNLINQETDLIQKNFQNKFLLIINNERQFIPNDIKSIDALRNEISEYKKAQNINNVKEQSNQELLDQYVFGANTSIKELKNTIKVYNQKFNNSAISIVKTLTNKEKYILERPYVSSKNGNYTKINIDQIIKDRLQNSFYQKDKLHKEYLDTLNNGIDTLSNTKEKINDYVYTLELNDYLSRVNKVYGKNSITMNNSREGELSFKALYNSFNPLSNTVYDLSGFKVFQSIKGGIIVTPNGSYQYPNKQLFFIKTNKTFVDNYVFKYGEYKILKAGIKKYNTVLGISKSIYSFKIINIDRSKYHYTF